MQVYLNEINGWSDVFTAMLMSNRNWSREKEEEIRDVVFRATDRKGKIFSPLAYDVFEVLDKKMKSALNWGRVHITLLSFVDFSFTVEGLHRAGQDDWDSHAKRFDNRIVRMSTRNKDIPGDVSEWYEDKIISTDEALSILEIKTPDRILKDGVAYVKATNGYVREDMKDDPNVKRGLYMLSIPSNFIFKINLMQFAHVFKERNELGAAHPEVKICCEKMADLLYEWTAGYVTRTLLMEIKN